MKIPNTWQKILQGGDAYIQVPKKTYEIYSDDEIAQSIRSMKKDTGSCSESCEAFNSDNLDLFPD